MTKAKFILTIILLLSLISISFISAADFDPRANITLRDRWSINGGIFSNFTYYIGDGSLLTNLTLFETDPDWSANLTNGVSDNLFPFTDSTSTIGTTLKRWLTGYFDNVESTAGNFSQLNATTATIDGFKTPQNNLFWNMYDTGTDMVLNVSNGGGDFEIMQENTKIVLFNTPVLGNDFKVFQVFSRTSSYLSEFVIAKQGIQLADYHARSLQVGASTTNCTGLTDMVGCDSDITGADLLVQDEIWSGGGAFFANGSVNITDDGDIVARGINLTDWSNVSITESQVSDLSHTTASDIDIYVNESGDTMTGDLSFSGGSNIISTSGGIDILTFAGDRGLTVSKDGTTQNALLQAAGSDVLEIHSDLDLIANNLNTTGDIEVGNVNVAGNLTMSITKYLRARLIEGLGSTGTGIALSDTYLSPLPFATTDFSLGSDLNRFNNLFLFGNATVAGNVSADFFIGDGSLLTNVPDSDTTYTNGTGLTLTGTEFNHSDSSSQADVDNSGTNVIQDIGLDDLGHIDSITSTDLGAHTTDTDTNASTICAGATTYLNGEATCVNIALVYEALLGTEAGLYSALSDVTEFIETGDAATLATLDTGQGANELYAMNQDVQTSDKVQFLSINASGGWENVTITESQVSDLNHPGSTNVFDQSLNISDNVTFSGINITNGSQNLGFYVAPDGKIGVNTINNLLDTFTVQGSIDLRHTSTETDDHAQEIEIDAAGFGGVKALFIDFITGNIQAGDDEEAIFININQFGSSGGEISGIEVVATEGSANVVGLEVGALVSPIEQLSGTFSNMDSALNTTIDVRAAFISTSTDINLFFFDNDYVTIGNAVKFEEIEFILDTVASGSGIKPAFYYSTGSGTWAEFNPADGTNGMRDTGVVIWLDSDIPGWNTGLATEYLIRINRTANSLSTPPREDKVQIASTIEYFWDKNGNIFVNEVNATRLNSVDWSNITILQDQVTDLSHPASSNVFDQSLNTSSNVTFYKLNLTDWTNVTITESQVTDLVHLATAIEDDLIVKADFADEDWGDISVATNVVTIDASVIDKANFANEDWGEATISGNTLTIDSGVIDADNLGADSVQDSEIDYAQVTLSDFTDDIGIIQNNTLGWILNFTNIFSDDWSNITLLSTQLNDGGTIGFDWIDAEVADTLTIDSSSSIDKGALDNLGTLGFDWADSEIADTLSIISGIIGSNSVSGTWTTTGTLTIGDGGDRIDIASNTWDVTNGVVSGVTTLDTGQGANELYDMDQNVLIASKVQFISINASGGWENVTITESQISDLVHTGASNVFDQSLNKSDNITFWALNLTGGWDNVTITEAQVTDLSHTSDTSADTICAGTTTYLDGEGNCDTGDISSFDTLEEIEDGAFAHIDDGTQTLIVVTYQDATDDIDFVVDGDLSNYNNDAGFITSGIENNTGGWNLSFYNITSTDWNNITILEGQVTDLSHTTDTDTNASSVCAGATTYLNGEATCIDISAVYEALLGTEAGLYSALSDVTEFLETGDAATLATLDTGQGANELYAMNQDVETSDSVQFLSVNASGGWENITIVESQITDLLHTVDTNETVFVQNLSAYDCGAGELVIGIQNNGTVLCAADTGGVNFFNQQLNTTSNVTFNLLTVTTEINSTSGWGNVTIIQSQITDLLHLATAITDDLIVKADFADEDWGDVSVATNAVTIDSGVVDADNLAANSVDSSELVDGGIDLSHMSSQSVDSDNIVEGTILAGDFSFDSAEVDGDYITYDSTGTNFAPLSPAEVLADIGAQASDAELTTIAGLAETNGNVMFVAGGAWTSDATPAIDCTDCTNVPAGAHAGTITWTGTSILETGAAFGFGDASDATLTHTYANTGTNVVIAFSSALMSLTGAFTSSGIITGTGFTAGSAVLEEAELEILDGATLSTTELNYVDGVTSAIQTQFTGKEVQLDNEAGLYAVLSDVTNFLQTNDAGALVTLDTGQGANELYDMDQNVLKASSVVFAEINVSDNGQLFVGNSTTWWNGSCLNTNVSGVLVQSIGCT